jgi:hypothetical protein
VRSVLDAVRLRKRTVAVVELRIGFSSSASISPSAGGGQAHYNLDVDGSLRDKVVYRLMSLLAETGLDRLLSCPASGCGRLFLKLTRKEFCSSRCQSRSYMQRFRAKEPEQEQERQHPIKRPPVPRKRRV